MRSMCLWRAVCTFPALAAGIIACGGDEKSPTQPAPITFTAVSAGGSHTCGVTAAGAAYCWGHNIYGQIGDGTTSNRTNPGLVPGGASWTAVSAGDFHTCGVTVGGATYCWGFNLDGQLGDGGTGLTPRLSPGLVATGVSLAAVHAGTSHTCGVTAAGAAYCWGTNLNGEVGDGTMSLGPLTPVLVAGNLTFAALSVGAYHTCGATATGAAYCWGYNLDAQLGDGTMTNRTTPVPVAGGVSFAAVSAGGGLTCGVTVGGAAYCWGLNNYGQLGDGTTNVLQLTPVLVASNVPFAAVSAGFFHTCGITAAGAAYCWGLNNYGQLGDGSVTDRSTPVLVAGGVSFAAVSVGGFHTCAVTAPGATYCWGQNTLGQLGDGTTINRNTPVRVVP